MVDSEDDPIVGDYGDWKLLTELPNFFNKTKLYNTLLVYFSELGHTHTVSDISDISSTYEPKIEDTGWIDLDFNDSQYFSPYNTTSYNPEARKIGKQVYVQGAVTNSSAVTSTNAGILIGKLPDGFAPSKNQYTIQQGTNAFRYMLIVNTSGQLLVARYTNSTSANGTVATGSWLGLYCSFAID